jgi:hypothetical protein
VCEWVTAAGEGFGIFIGAEAEQMRCSGEEWGPRRQSFLGEQGGCSSPKFEEF